MADWLTTCTPVSSPRCRRGWRWRGRRHRVGAGRRSTDCTSLRRGTSVTSELLRMTEPLDVARNTRATTPCVILLLSADELLSPVEDDDIVVDMELSLPSMGTVVGIRRVRIVRRTVREPAGGDVSELDLGEAIEEGRRAFGLGYPPDGSVMSGVDAAVRAAAPIIVAAERAAIVARIEAEVLAGAVVPEWAQAGGKPTAAGIRRWVIGIVRGEECTCPTLDMSQMGDPVPGARTTKGLDERCPVHGGREAGDG